MAIIVNTGKFVGNLGAKVLHGTQLGASQFAQGARQGYSEERARLLAKRQAAAAAAYGAKVVDVEAKTVAA